MYKMGRWRDTESIEMDFGTVFQFLFFKRISVEVTVADHAVPDVPPTGYLKSLL
jgi:hypothetical protein